VKKTKLVRQK